MSDVELPQDALIDCILHVDARFRNIYTYCTGKKEFLHRARSEYCFMLNISSGLQYLYKNAKDIIEMNQHEYGLISLNIPFTMVGDAEDEVEQLVWNIKMACDNSAINFNNKEHIGRSRFLFFVHLIHFADTYIKGLESTPEYDEIKSYIGIVESHLSQWYVEVGPSYTVAPFYKHINLWRRDHMCTREPYFILHMCYIIYFKKITELTTSKMIATIFNIIIMRMNKGKKKGNIQVAYGDELLIFIKKWFVDVDDSGNEIITSTITKEYIFAKLESEDVNVGKKGKTSNKSQIMDRVKRRVFRGL